VTGALALHQALERIESAARGYVNVVVAAASKATDLFLFLFLFGKRYIFS
jgi:hypothetical protein